MIVGRTRCDVCGLEHDRRVHMAGQIREIRSAELRRDHERRRASKIVAAKLAADRFRERAAGVPPASASTPRTEATDRSRERGARTPQAFSPAPRAKAARDCQACDVRPRHGPLPWCDVCAVARGYQRCSGCSGLKKAAKLKNGTCSTCRPKAKCADCGRIAPIKKSRWCHKCSLRNGWKLCSTCGKPFEPSKKHPRRRRCPKCVDKYAVAGPRGSGSSVRTVSGGLPSLGRRR